MAHPSAETRSTAVPSGLPPVSAEHRRIAAERFDRATQVLVTGNYEYGIQLLLTCCKLDPANLIYRQALRRAQKLKFKNNLHGSTLSVLTSSPDRARLKTAKSRSEHLAVLEYGEKILSRNPWDSGAQIDMAAAAEALGLLDMAIFILEQARQKAPEDASVNRPLARLYEKRGNFAQAIALWQLVKKALPTDREAGQKEKDLHANETILRGNYKSDGTGGKPIAPTDDAGLELTPSPGKTTAVDRAQRDFLALTAKLAADPTRADTYLQLAQIHRKQGQAIQARDLLKQGLAASGQAFELNLELTDLEIDPFRRDLALANARLESQPDDAKLSAIQQKLTKEINTRELELYRQKADRYPMELGHRLEMGIRLLKAEQLDEAIRELQAARPDPRLRWKALYYLGYCFRQRNNWRLAERNFEEALQAVPPTEPATRKEILFQIAHGAAQANDLSKALEVGHELANLEFSYRDIGTLLDEWQRRVEGV